MQIALNAARSKADADYVRRIQSKIRGNVVLPPDIQFPPSPWLWQSMQLGLPLPAFVWIL